MKHFDKDNLPDDLSGLSFRNADDMSVADAVYTITGRNSTGDWLTTRTSEHSTHTMSLHNGGLRSCIRKGIFVITRPEGWEEESPPNDEQEVIEI